MSCTDKKYKKGEFEFHYKEINKNKLKDESFKSILEKCDVYLIKGRYINEYTGFQVCRKYAMREYTYLHFKDEDLYKVWQCVTSHYDDYPDPDKTALIYIEPYKDKVFGEEETQEEYEIQNIRTELNITINKLMEESKSKIDTLYKKLKTPKDIDDLCYTN